MKNTLNILSVAVCGLVLTFTTLASAQEVKQDVVTIARVQSPASYTLGGNDGWHPLVAGKKLRAGSSIKTGPGGTVDVVMGNIVHMPESVSPQLSSFGDDQVRGLVSYMPSVEQNVVRLSGDTTLKFDKLTTSETGADTVSDTELDLQQGRIFCSVKKLSGASQYLVKIPNGIAGVRGTRFSISADGSCAVLKNSVLLSLVGPDGAPTTVLVNEGSQYNPSNGQTAPMSPQLSNLLNEIAAAAGSSLQVAGFSADSTRTFVSPVGGHFRGEGA